MIRVPATIKLSWCLSNSFARPAAVVSAAQSFDQAASLADALAVSLTQMSFLFASSRAVPTRCSSSYRQLRQRRPCRPRHSRCCRFDAELRAARPTNQVRTRVTGCPVFVVEYYLRLIYESRYWQCRRVFGNIVARPACSADLHV